MSPETRELADFAGAWRLSREILHASGATFGFEGWAHFRWDGTVLVQQEEGWLQPPGGPPMRAERRYLWRGGLEVSFEDGRPFHIVPPRGGRAEHSCPPDHYVVAYDFDRWPLWRSVWQVAGPRKAYEMISAYQKA
jgi:hypothetical protein